MKITLNHKSAATGVPVILDRGGRVMPYANGIKALRFALTLSTSELAAAIGVSRRTVEGWEGGRQPNAASLNAMEVLLATKKHAPF